jgi:archaellum component FlaF (FlaF/FlaG flagellin family)
MAYEITNTLRSTSIIRVVDAGTYTVPVANLAVDANENVTSASIRRVMWSTGGSISVTRNSIPLLSLHGSGDMRLSDSGHVVANSSTSDIVITVTTSGSAVLEISKQATYTTPLTGI